jgi:hypothetical protein
VVQIPDQRLSPAPILQMAKQLQWLVHLEIKQFTLRELEILFCMG